MSDLEWPERCHDCGGPEVEMAIVSKSGKAPSMYLCRTCALRFLTNIAIDSIKKLTIGGFL